MAKKNTVYSTETGRMCPGCCRPKAECVCKGVDKKHAGDGVIKISRETKGRKGKGVSLISGFTMSDAEIKILAKELKKVCGTGGAVKDGVIEIQGDKRDELVAVLEKRGFNVKRSGG